MFLCGACSRPIGPKVSPVKVTPAHLIRKVRYENGTIGTEIMAEFKLCHECAGIPTEIVDKPPLVMTISEPMAAPVKISLASMCVSALIERSTHQTKRATRDFEAAYPLLKRYEQRGGSL